MCVVIPIVGLNEQIFSTRFIIVKIPNSCFVASLNASISHHPNYIIILPKQKANKKKKPSVLSHTLANSEGKVFVYVYMFSWISKIQNRAKRLPKTDIEVEVEVIQTKAFIIFSIVLNG